MANKINSCVFISGNGSNLKSLIKSSRDYSFPIKIKLIISNNANAKGLRLAKKYSISCAYNYKDKLIKNYCWHLRLQFINFFFFVINNNDQVQY